MRGGKISESDLFALNSFSSTENSHKPETGLTAVVHRLCVSGENNVQKNNHSCRLIFNVAAECLRSTESFGCFPLRSCEPRDLLHPMREELARRRLRPRGIIVHAQQRDVTCGKFHAAIHECVGRTVAGTRQMTTRERGGRAHVEDAQSRMTLARLPQRGHRERPRDEGGSAQRSTVTRVETCAAPCRSRAK